MVRTSIWLVIVVTGISIPPMCIAQGSLRDSLQRLDVNDDGKIQPSEVTPLARPYLERVAKYRKLSLSKENDIEQWQVAARIYHAIQNGVSGERISPEPSPNVKGFGPQEREDDDNVMVPEFGLGVIKYPYSRSDLQRAESTINRYDRNGDNHLSVSEADRAKWNYRDPFEMDLNEDKRLSRMELAQRYARRRLLNDSSDQLEKRVSRVGSETRPFEPPKREERDSRVPRDRNAYLPGIVLGRFDENRNGRLEANEAARIGVPIGRIDADRNGELSTKELHNYFTKQQEQFEQVSDVVPGWFYELDENRDDQIVMTEFTSEWSVEKLTEFNLYDSNQDGILTPHEVLHSKALVGGSYENTTAEVIPPRKTIISEIEITDDFEVGDLNLQLSITHTHDMALDGFLTGPDGTRIELFTAVGGHDDHFDKTIFDDQSSRPITKARPPFRGTYQPEGTSRRQPGLFSFNGKSIKGVWQLVIDGSRSDRFGVLHSWKLIVIPDSDLIGGAAPKPLVDGDRPGMVAANRGKPDRGKSEAKQARQGEDKRRKVENKIDQASGWQQKIRERLADPNIDQQERDDLRRKMGQIERYKEMLRRGDKFDKSAFKKKD